MLRRKFLQSAMALPALAQGRKIKLGIDTYSIRSSRWKAPRLLDYAASLKLDAVQMSQVDFESLEEPYLLRLKEQAKRLGIGLEPGFGCICPVSNGWNAARAGDPVRYIEEGIRVTKTLGGTAFRVFIGGLPDRVAGTSIAAMMESAIKSLRAAAPRARDAGIRIAIENHGDLLARQMRTVIEEAGRDVAASCFDSGNPVNLAEDPLLAFEVLGPYIVTSHIRDSVVYEHPRGAAVQWVALGEGVIDLKRLARRWAEVCPQAPFLLEIITGRPPQVLPYLEPAFWKGFGDTPAADFARFAAIAKAGHPFMGTMMIAGTGTQPKEFRDALVLQERLDLERSLEYARKILLT
ncbi:MAG: sugar phosphate isomerase/epimerase [Candidatus Solibacter usitatus]|nr:sugar phosphate isomerase/epimerase [Candidatus Solibacter usitatus]